MNAFNDKKLDRLKQAVYESRRRLEKPRTERTDSLKCLAGRHYTDNASSIPRPLNLIELGTTVYLSQLSANCPQVMVTTAHQGLKRSAYAFQLGLNHLLKDEIDFTETHYEWVLDALFGMGILKVGICPGYEVEIDGFLHDVGQPFADRISFDDWVMDMRAKRWDQIQFCGDRYALPLDAVKESPLYDKKVTGKLKATERQTFNESGGERSETISRGTGGEQEEQLHETIELWDLWLPVDGVVMTFAADQGQDTIQGQPLRVTEWSGPEGGPYERLWFGTVPDQLLPAPPVSHWRDIDDPINRLYNKLIRQAERQKTVLPVRRQAADDGKRTVEVGDGEVFGVDQMDAPKEVSLGGIHQGNLAFVIDAIGRWSWSAGNIDALGGLAAMSGTVGQDRLMAENASQRINKLKERVLEGTRRVCESIGWYLWHDPLIELPIVKRIPGSDVSVQSYFRPEDREGDFVQYNFKIEPHSLSYMSPAEKVAQLDDTMARMMELMPIMMQNGQTINIEGYLRTRAELMQMPFLDDLVIFGQLNPLYQQQPVGESPKMPTTTTRRYERINRSSATRPGMDSMKTLQLLGNNAQTQQAQSMMSGAA